MRLHHVAALTALPLLAACAAPQDPTEGGAVPEQVTALAAPYQDLSTARLREDGCYWYLHSGPVEATLLPLRTREGRPICTGPAA
jgi:hypothetical protein